MLRVCLKGANSAARKCLCGQGPSHPLQQCRRYTAGGSGGSAGKVIAAGFLTVGGGVGGTVLYANWDPKFRTTVEQNVPYSDTLFGMALGPIPASAPTPLKKQLELSQPPSLMFEESKPKAEKKKKKEETAESPAPETSPTTQTLEPAPEVTEESSLEASLLISGLSEVPCVPAPHDTELTTTPPAEECKECHHETPAPAVAPVLEAPAPAEEPLKERPVEEVSARLAQQDQADEDSLTALSASLEENLATSAKAALHAIGAQEAALQAIALHTFKLKEAMEAESPPDQKSAQWKDLEAALNDRSRTVDEAGAALLKAKDALETLRSAIDKGKGSKVVAVRPLVLAAEENLHSMVVDLDQVVTKVVSAQSEAKIVSQYSELVNEAKVQFQKELSSITPEVQANWKGLTGKLTADDLNSLIAHAHRRIDQLNREMAEQRVREQIHVETALEQQKLADQKMLEQAVGTALEHSREEARLEQERKLVELREVMEAEMRTQLRRQAAAHTDHLRDVLKVQEQELRAEAEEVLSGKMLEQETLYRRLTQDQLDNFTLDMNAAYARLKGMEEAIDSHVIAEEEARKAHTLWLSVEGLNFALRTSGADSPTEPLDGAAAAVRDSCAGDDFAQALAGALPGESLRRGVYSEASLRARFYALRQLARRVALVDEQHNSLYQYFLSYAQAALLFEERELAPPPLLAGDDLDDPFRILAYATYCLERGDLELAAKLVNQLRGEARRVVQDWLAEARLTLETRQVVGLLSAYANAVGLGTTQAP